ncbi:MAG: hypothetical protein P1V97_27195 [Planctomycetota bacterium]|nr:hypothetical protein [Planctomycetota bacterium]
MARYFATSRYEHGSDLSTSCEAMIASSLKKLLVAPKDTATLESAPEALARLPLWFRGKSNDVILVDRMFEVLEALMPVRHAKESVDVAETAHDLLKVCYAIHNVVAPGASHVDSRLVAFEAQFSRLNAEIDDQSESWETRLAGTGSADLEKTVVHSKPLLRLKPRQLLEAGICDSVAPSDPHAPTSTEPSKEAPPVISRILLVAVTCVWIVTGVSVGVLAYVNEGLKKATQDKLDAANTTIAAKNIEIAKKITEIATKDTQIENLEKTEKDLNAKLKAQKDSLKRLIAERDTLARQFKETLGSLEKIVGNLKETNTKTKFTSPLEKTTKENITSLKNTIEQPTSAESENPFEERLLTCMSNLKALLVLSHRFLGILKYSYGEDSFKAINLALTREDNRIPLDEKGAFLKFDVEIDSALLKQSHLIDKAFSDSAIRFRWPTEEGDSTVGQALLSRDINMLSILRDQYVIPNKSLAVYLNNVDQTAKLETEKWKTWIEELQKKIKASTFSKKVTEEFKNLLQSDPKQVLQWKRADTTLIPAINFTRLELKFGVSQKD